MIDDTDTAHSTALLQSARQALAAQGGRIATFLHDGQRYAAKAPGAERGLLQALMLKLFCRLTLGCGIPLASLRLRDGRGRLAYEAARLRALAASGEAVPEVAALAADCMVLGHVGNTLEQSLADLSREQATAALHAAIDDLVRFHRAGNWHGGSQVKNMTLQDARLFRIDFEEDVGEHLPLPILQAYDLILLVNSATLLWGMDEETSQDLAVALLRRYLRLRPDASSMRAILERARPWLAFLSRLLAPWRQRRGRSLRRIFLLRHAIDKTVGDG